MKTRKSRLPIPFYNCKIKHTQDYNHYLIQERKAKRISNATFLQYYKKRRISNLPKGNPLFSV